MTPADLKTLIKSHALTYRTAGELMGHVGDAQSVKTIVYRYCNGSREIPHYRARLLELELGVER